MDAGQLLDRRTAALAARAVATEVATRPLVVWSLEGSLFGIDPAAVAAIIPYPGCTAVPGRQAACLGVVSRLGRFYSVIGLRRLLAMPEQEAPGHLLLLRGASPALALAVDRVLGRFDVTQPDVRDGPSAIVGGSADVHGRLVAAFDQRQLLQRLGAVA